MGYLRFLPAFGLRTRYSVRSTVGLHVTAHPTRFHHTFIDMRAPVTIHLPLRRIRLRLCICSRFTTPSHLPLRRYPQLRLPIAPRYLYTPLLDPVYVCCYHVPVFNVPDLRLTLLHRLLLQLITVTFVPVWLLIWLLFYGCTFVLGLLI